MKIRKQEFDLLSVAIRVHPWLNEFIFGSGLSGEESSSLTR
jgi:hypothetical protein